MVAIRKDTLTVKLLSTLIGLMAFCASVALDSASAQTIPLPRQRPPQAGPPQAAVTETTTPPEPAPPSACRLRLTVELAAAPSLPAFAGAGECEVEDMVRLEAVMLPDKTRVAVLPPALLRCPFAEAVVHWVRDDVASAMRSQGRAVKGIDNFASYECRGRNRLAGAKVSEHGKGNALDVRSIRLADGKILELTDPHVPKELRETLRRSACERFTTVLGPGSDGYHENHVHLDLIERRRGHRICQWDVREPSPEPGPELTSSADRVPLPRPRPTAAAR
jgi:hypothetical protein